MKNLRTLLIIVALVVLSACSNESYENEKVGVKKFIMEYKTEQYAVKNPSNPPTAIEIGERVKPYLSEEAYDDFFINRYFNFITKVAQNTGYKSTLVDVSLEKTEENDDGSMDYDYTIIVKYYNDSFSELVETEGQITVQLDGEQYVITRDWEQPNEFIQEAILIRN